LIDRVVTIVCRQAVGPRERQRKLSAFATQTLRILVYALNYSPELTGIGKYVGEMVDWLAQVGHEVQVITTHPYYPDWEKPADCSPFRSAKEIHGEVRITRVPIYVPRKPTGLKRIVHLASFAVRSAPSLLRASRWKPDVVWVVEPPLFASPGALVLSKLTGAKSWLHIQDFEVDMGFSLGLMRGAAIRKFVFGIERSIIRRFDRVSAISHAMLRRAAQKGARPERLVFFPNWVDTQSIRPLSGPNPIREKLGLNPNDCVALYSGNMGAKQGLEILAEAAQLLRDDPSIKFVFCGSGASRSNLEIACSGLPNVHFLPLQPSEQLGALLSAADVHLLPQRADAADLVLPSKLNGMLASGRPIVATASADSTLGQIVAKCGLVVPAGNGQAVAEALTRLRSDSEMRGTLGQAARAYAEAWLTAEKILGAFEIRLRELVQRPSAPEERRGQAASAAGD
jgi:colanic acid biosynthesis glycosyl transferase WcaI